MINSLETKDYVSMHNHSYFSILNSLTKPKDLFLKAKELGQSAIAVTDYSLAGAWDSLKASKETGVKLIIGCELNFVNDVANKDEPIRHIILLAKNHQGYKNLLKILRTGYENNIIAFKRVMPRIDWNLLEKYKEGLICTTACGGGILGKLINTRQFDEARSQAIRLKSIFGDNLAFEIEPHAMRRNQTNYNEYEDQTLVNRRLIQLGDELGVKVIAATNSHYLNKEQAKAHDVVCSIAAGVPIRYGNRLKYDVPEFYVKSRQEIIDFFYRNYKGRAEEFCDNTLYFSNQCEFPEWIDPKFSNPSGSELPEFPVKDQPDYEEFRIWFEEKRSSDNKFLNLDLKEDAAYLRYWCDKEFSSKVPVGKEEEYRARLDEEFEVIELRNFSSYLAIVANYINHCKKSNIITGVGRGSVGGSCVAYLLGIHQADPIKYGLIFARFINKEKLSFPDVDSDFSSEGKKIVEQYLVDKYGAEYVAHISNFNTMTPKVYARDIARAHQFGGDRKKAVDIGNNLADAIPDDAKSFSNLLEKAPLFAEYANQEEYSCLKNYLNDLGGLIRANATHAGGNIISKRPLVEIVPTRIDKEGSVVIEYEKERAEENGLIKMDILGVSTLDIIANSLKIIESLGKPKPTDHTNYDKYDELTYNLISFGDTFTVFQLGTSSGTIDLCKKIKPKTIPDIAAINALARPAAKDIRADFISVRNGETPIKLLHPSLKRAFEFTYGFGVYEESLLRVAEDVAGWNLHKADGLRKFTKDKGKNPEKAKKLRKEFIEDSILNGIEKEAATEIWNDVIENFGSYGFNLSHAIFYSMLGYQTAYLKAHYPLEFLVSNLMSEDTSNAKMSSKNINKIKKELRTKGFSILSPHVGKSKNVYNILDEKTIITGFDSIKFMGKDAVPEILQKQPFSSFEDFMVRIDARKVTIRSVQAMIASGCFDDFGFTRKQMFLYSGDYRKKLTVWKKRKKQEPFDYPWPDVGEWTVSEKYALEVYYLGEGFSCGKRYAYTGFFDNRAIDFSKLEDLFPESTDRDDLHITSSIGVVEGVLVDYYEHSIKKEGSKLFGQIMSRLELEDPFGNVISMAAFPQGLEKLYRRLKELTGGKVKLEPGIAIHCAASVNWYDGNLGLVFEDLKNVTTQPSLPKELKHQKIDMKITSGKKQKTNKIDPQELLEDIEDEMDEEGLSEIF